MVSYQPYNRPTNTLKLGCSRKINAHNSSYLHLTARKWKETETLSLVSSAVQCSVGVWGLWGKYFEDSSHDNELNQSGENKCLWWPLAGLAWWCCSCIWKIWRWRWPLLINLLPPCPRPDSPGREPQWTWVLACSSWRESRYLAVTPYSLYFG